MTSGGDRATTQARAAVWCGSCGIPYAADTVYCAICAAPLAALADDRGVVAPGPPAPSPLTDPVVPHTRASAESPPAVLAAPDVDAPLAVPDRERLSDDAEGAAQSLVSTGVRTLDGASPHAPRGLLDRVRQRQQAMSEDEIDAAAAAIIAQARHADRLDTANGAPGDALATLADLAPDPPMEEALRQRRERDRAWLIGGIVCCVLLIVFALMISRSMSVGMLRQ